MTRIFKDLNFGLICCVAALLFLSACSNQEEVSSTVSPKISDEKTAALAGQIHQDLDQIAKAALQYTAEKGEASLTGRGLKGYLQPWPSPPQEVRDPIFNFEWDYVVAGTLGDMGGPTSQPDTAVFLEGVTEQVCLSFNRAYSSLGGKASDFLGKRERPDSERWCENGGNPYRIIQVVSLR